MLDLDHPMTQYIFAAAGAEDAVLIAARQMTVSSSQERARLRDRCTAAFAELRRLARDHFADRPAIPSAIDALELAMVGLASLSGVPEHGPPAQYECPACGTALERRGKNGFPAPENPTDIYCSPCLQIIMPSLSVLRSWEGGFGTDFI
jgi:hypothetical protein